jgi:putative cell wall-binding protein
VPIPLRHASALVIALVLSALLIPPAPAWASASDTEVEVRLTELVNASRAQHGLQPLRVDVRLVASARGWSAEMARQGRLAHDPHLQRGIPAGARAWAENVAVTSRTDDPAGAIHRMLMDSAPHRRNILDGRFTDLGIGVARGGGRTWATQRLTAGAPATVAPAVEGLASLTRSTFGSGGAAHAVIARDDVFADALAAGPLAGRGGPILLSPPGPVLHPAARVALERVLPRGRTIWLVGGTSAVSDGVAGELRGAGWDVRRASGTTRVGTAEAVARQVVARDGRPATALAATGWDWPDAVTGGAYGARAGAPIVLTEPNRVPAETHRALEAVRPGGVAVLGGSAAVSDRVVRDLGGTRVAGATRQSTSAATAESLWGYRDAAPQRWIAAPAFGDDAWTWALGAAPLAARTGAAVLLVGPQLDPDLRDYVAGLGYGGGRSAELLTVGPVPTSGADELRALLR